MHEIEN